jgi:hypothetical protein
LTAVTGHPLWPRSQVEVEELQTYPEVYRCVSFRPRIALLEYSQLLEKLETERFYPPDTSPQLEGLEVETRIEVKPSFGSPKHPHVRREDISFIPLQRHIPPFSTLISVSLPELL